ncbi:hypothetical protein F5Y08DRAFT_315077 [Xylaria arbuscula]|nr:hypothetical protein F5Y08DRAFT_315077 [Xylaria arbuscula]
MHHFGRWAGKNIVCVGEDVNPNDYPPGLFSKEELEVLRQKTTMIWDDYGDVETQPFTLYHFTYPRVSRRQIVKSDLYHIAGDLDDSCYDRGLRKDPTYEMHIRPYLRATQETYFPTDQLWILRNLTMKQIVRADAIALSPDYINGPDIKFLGFPEVILSRISWSSSQPIGFEEKSVRGVWAGHCFDITTLSKHKTETREEEWTDVSEEVSKEITSDWEAKIGANWREIITRSERW